MQYNAMQYNAMQYIRMQYIIEYAFGLHNVIICITE